MADWRLNPALTGFRAAVNDAYPSRDEGSDGTIGDQAHQGGTSDHNPDPDGSVDAWDMDVELLGKGKPYAAAVEHLKDVFEAHPSSGYWIHNDQIARRQDGWRRRPYPEFNDDPDRNRHTKHVHWNTRSTFENDTTSWDVEDDMATAKEIWDHRIGSPALGDRTAADWIKAGVVASNKVDSLAAQVRMIAETIASLVGNDEILNKLEEMDAEATDRYSELRALIEQYQSGQLSAEAVVDEIAARLAT